MTRIKRLPGGNAGDGKVHVPQRDLPLFHSREVPHVRGQPAAGEPRLVQIARGRIEYTLKRSKRRSIGFVVRDQGLTVTAPRSIGISQIEHAIAAKQQWILAKLAEMIERQKRVTRICWREGGSVPYLGEPAILRIGCDATAVATHSRKRSSSQVRLADQCTSLHVSLSHAASGQHPSDAIRDAVRTWLRAEARRVLLDRLEFFAKRMSVCFESFRLSSAATRWGSCNAKGRILLNWRLIHFPRAAIDYVVVHELAHLKEMNHGPRFWSAVAEVLPDFQIERAYLKRAPPELLPRF